MYSWARNHLSKASKNPIINYLQFFTDQPVEVLGKSYLRNEIIWLPPTPEFMKFTYDDFFMFLYKNFGQYMTWLSHIPIKTLGCKYNKCETSEQLESALINQSQIPTDPFEFYDYMTQISRGLDDTEIKQLSKEYHI